MNHPLQRPTAALALATSVAATVLPCTGVAQGDQEIELIEAKTALDAALARVEELRGQLALAQEQNGALGEGLAAANGEAEASRESYKDLRLQLEALGVDVLRKDSRGLDRRLLQAVSDLRLSQEENTRLRDQLVRLSEAAMDFVASTVGSDAAAKARLETALTEAETALRPAGAEGDVPEGMRTLDGARVVSIKPDFGLLVLDAGEADRVTPGTPIKIRRDGQDIARAIVVDVRSAVCGAVLTGQTPDSTTVRVGDIARLDTQKPLQN